jgi:hypothetical protein
VLRKSLREEVAKQIEKARVLWQNDREAGVAGVYLPRITICGKVAGASRSRLLSGRLRPDQGELMRDASATVWSGTLQPLSW